MKKIILILLLLNIFVGCTSFKHIVIINGDEKYENSGHLKITPDYESPTFNITIKDENGEETTFFGNDLNGYITDTKSY